MPFWVGFPVSAVKYFSKLKFCIHDCHFWVRFPVSAVKHFSKFGILHLRLPFLRSNSGDHDLEKLLKCRNVTLFTADISSGRINYFSESSSLTVNLNRLREIPPNQNSRSFWHCPFGGGGGGLHPRQDGLGHLLCLKSM